MTKVLVLYYSMYGHIEAMAQAVAEGVREVEGADARSLYNKLETIIIPMFYKEGGRYDDVMRNAIALNGSFFNTERMLNQYIAKAYFK